MVCKISILVLVMVVMSNGREEATSVLLSVKVTPDVTTKGVNSALLLKGCIRCGPSHKSLLNQQIIMISNASCILWQAGEHQKKKRARFRGVSCLKDK